MALDHDPCTGEFLQAIDHDTRLGRYLPHDVRGAGWLLPGDDALHESFYAAERYKDSATEGLARELHEQGEAADRASAIYRQATAIEPWRRDVTDRDVAACAVCTMTIYRTNGDGRWHHARPLDGHEPRPDDGPRGDTVRGHMPWRPAPEWVEPPPDGRDPPPADR